MRDRGGSRGRRRWRALARPPVPHLVGLLADCWQLSPAQASDFWAALSKARWSRAVNWRQQLLLFEAVKGAPPADGPHPWLYGASAPRETIAVVEDLYHEGLITRTQTTHLQEHILHTVGPTGAWRFHGPPVEPAPGLDLNAVIEQYWR